MPTRDTAPLGAPCWIDLMTSDPDRARAFYPALFGWVAEEPSEEFGGYFMFTLNGVPIGGGMPAQAGGPADFWSIYLATDDARKTLDTAVANGGSIVVEPMPVADLGVMGVLTGPDGAAVGIWQPGTFHGIGVLGEAGAPSWFELYARDYEGSLRFYREVFRWDTQVISDTAEFRYSILRHGELQLAGVADASQLLPADVPPHWTVYFGTPDADATAAKAVGLGGTVLRPAEDTPYGRLATLADPTGTPFRIVAPNESMPG